jgi:cardiolipin synthase
MSHGVDPVVLTAFLELVAVIVHVVIIGAVLLTRRRDPSTTLAWILFIVVAPVVGACIYVVFGRTRIRRTVKRSGRAETRLRRVLSRYDVFDRLVGRGSATMSARTKAQVHLGNALASTPASAGNKIQVLTDAAMTYRDMVQAIEQAEHHIHVEFYIFQPDAVGRALRDQFVRKAASGVEVRVICDAVGSSALPSGFWKPLVAAGGNAAYFSPLTKLRARLQRRDRFDFRDHRKIVVIDGKIGYTGGINVGREYLGLDPSIGRWRDTHLRIDGPAVLSLQYAFSRSWLMTTGETLDDERYFPDCPVCGDSAVQIVDSGPDRNWPTMELYYTQIIAMARERVWITNPYFIPSQAIESVLYAAALRGVDVRLLLPKKSDSRLVTLASRSYYSELLHAGTRIFEYKHGFVHAKTMVVDDWVATIGSANMDLRSFNLNFELNAFVFGSEVCRTVAENFQVDLMTATEVTLQAERRIPIHRRLLCASARLLSPLL